MRKLFLVMLLGTSPALAQENGPIQPMPMQGGMDHSAMMGAMGMGAGMGSGMGPGMGSAPVSEPGQGAFAAIGEIVAALQADPDTDWDSVDIDALRTHLVDMDMVITWTEVVREPITSGERYIVTATDDRVVEAVQRMLVGHAQVMNGVDDWTYKAEVLENGAALSVSVPEADMAKLRGLGFYGILTSGMHHQPHHWAMARGQGMSMDAPSQ